MNPVQMESKLGIVFSILSYFFPSKEIPPLDNYNIIEVRKKFSGVEKKLIFYLFTLTPIIIAILFLFFRKVQELYLLYLQGDSLHIEGLGSAVFFLPALFTGLLISGVIVEKLVIYHSKKISWDEDEFKVFYYDLNVRQALGNKISKLGIYITVLVPTILSLLIIFPLGLHDYTKFYEDSITYSRFFSLREESFMYQDIGKIIYIDSFRNLQTNLIESTRPYYLVIMKDGSRWNTLNLKINGSIEELDLVIKMSDKSGVSIESGVKNVDDTL